MCPGKVINAVRDCLFFKSRDSQSRVTAFHYWGRISRLRLTSCPRRRFRVYVGLVLVTFAPHLVSVSVVSRLCCSFVGKFGVAPPKIPENGKFFVKTKRTPKIASMGISWPGKKEKGLGANGANQDRPRHTGGRETTATPKPKKHNETTDAITR